jgi:uncharacterized protein YyaL (SSP411 family)
MAHESFEDPATASYLNKHFVNIKVDREERPDVDAVYMQATVAMTGQGGWPMTVVLDHDGQPFFAGTYFPDKPRHGMPAFTQVLQALTDAWAHRRDEVDRSAAGIAEHLRREPALAGTDLIDDAVLAGAVTQSRRDFDTVNGGFGGAPKFPPSMLLQFLLRRGDGLDLVEQTLLAMARGGMYDQLGGGFARYSVDAGWVVPHFEKMLYDNAQLLRLYADWHAATGAELAGRVARETAGFLLRELGTPEGGFASALDADSDGAEGTFYVWTPAQLVEVLGEHDGRWAAELLGVTEAGTFEHGSSTLQLRVDPPPEEVPRWLAVKEQLYDARERRTRPERDDKVVAAWNGLAITGLVRAGLVLDDERLVEAARRAGELLWSVHWSGERLRRVSRNDVVGAPAGVLEDYACMADGFLALVQATAEPVWLERAGVLLDVALDQFAAGDGGFYDTAGDAESLVARPRDPSDNASPSGFSALVHALSTYAALTGSAQHRDAAERALATIRPLAERAPRFAGWSLAAAQTMLHGPVEVVVVEAGDEAGVELGRIARSLPDAVTLVVPADAVTSDAGIPLLRERGLVDGQSAAYVCRNLVCARPVTTPEELRSALAGAPPA